jgi:phytoene dehydrogenase-like protein
VNNETERFDAVVVGSGPNGLAAAMALARARKSVLVLEASDTLGGGLRSAELTLPGFVHDLCAEVLPLTIGSPFLSTIPLADFGLQLLQPQIPLAHPLDDGRAAVLDRSVERTARGLNADGAAYTRLMRPIVENWRPLLEILLGPLRWPARPLPLARFGLAAILPATVLARISFRQAPAQALLGGLSAHSILPLERPASAAVGLVLAMLAHTVGWPIARGGSQRVADALLGYLGSLSGQTRSSTHVSSIADLPRHKATLFDLTPRQILEIEGTELPNRYRRQLARYRYGPGIFKVDWALETPIPWQAEECRAAGTVHLGGTLGEVAEAEAAVWRGEHPAQPFVILAQPTVVDPSRAPPERHIAWAYCHVPNGSTVDMASAIEAQVERFAPGFTRRILARGTRNACQMQAYNPNYVGGDINGGVQDLLQLWTRPVPRPDPYSTPNPRIFICSSATPPGGGVHGMCGFYAARSALRRALVTTGRG